MDYERTQQPSEPTVSRNQPMPDQPMPDDGVDIETPGTDTTAGRTKSHEAATTRHIGPHQDPDSDKQVSRQEREAKPAPKEVSEIKVRMRSRLPALDDDADVGVQKEQIVTRDGKADLGFTGVLLASAAPTSAPKEHWQEYRIYQTTGGKHVFSKVSRTVFLEDEDEFEAEVFDPSPSSVPSQLLRSAREIARSRPLTWIDAAVAFFGYDPLAKVLYRKLSVRFEERIN